MFQVKLPYCKIMATVSETPFGVQELDCPKVYDKPIQNKIILRVDILDKLHDRFDAPCFAYREIIYALFSGSKGYYDCNDIFYSYYRKFASFRKIVNEAYYYGDDRIPLFERVVMPIRDELNKHTAQTIKLLHDNGGKYLTSTHDYVYFAFPIGSNVPEIPGGVKIC